MNNKMLKFNLAQRKNKNIPDLRSGDIIKVYRKIVEGQKERIQVFEGMIIAINGKQSSSPTITVRKVSGGVGTELVLPVFSPNIEKIEVVKRARVRRSKLYYIRDKSAKSLRLKYKDIADFALAEEAVNDGNSQDEAKEESLEEKTAKKEKNYSQDEKKSEAENSEEVSNGENEEKKQEAA
ncbi:MAG: 50S ribosomal protein L19 [Candidatus Moranbacteria bacterium]|jgi:large subunit ribosomal protein L19|nr:50S ribosomal protein L19 [Candidatus Moranbacteria bacterium]MDD5652302.1 50S ribosomal protein L19 [Candidatus Moranbacteria bacterium]MDX9855831.1 50S ribosomal protein L19 [Candidatus Moranbacteria bacterium]